MMDEREIWFPLIDADMCIAGIQRYKVADYEYKGPTWAERRREFLVNKLIRTHKRVNKAINLTITSIAGVVLAILFILLCGVTGASTTVYGVLLGLSVRAMYLYMEDMVFINVAKRKK